MSDVKDFSIKNYYPREIAIDDEDLSGEKLPIRIRRFTVAQLKDFQRGFERLVNPLSERFIYRKPDGDEQALKEDGKTYVTSAAEITRRREVEMTPEVAAEYAAAKDLDDAHTVDFCSAAIRDHVWLSPKATLTIVNDDDSKVRVTDGAGLVVAFGGNLSMLIRMTKAIHEENTLTPEAKKLLRSLSDSTASSPAPRGDGKTPAATVTNAEAQASASSGAVSADQVQTPSGLIPVAT